MKKYLANITFLAKQVFANLIRFALSRTCACWNILIRKKFVVCIYRWIKMRLRSDINHTTFLYRYIHRTVFGSDVTKLISKLYTLAIRITPCTGRLTIVPTIAQDTERCATMILGICNESTINTFFALFHTIIQCSFIHQALKLTAMAITFWNDIW